MEEPVRNPKWISLPEISLDRFEEMDASAESDGQAIVVRAWDLQLERYVALKYSVDPALLGDMSPEQLDGVFGPERYDHAMVTKAARAGRRYNLLREARLLAMVDHPNVMPILEVGRFGHQVCVLLLPYLEGGTAAKRSFASSWQSVLDTALQIGRGLAALHDVGILHRDFKPNNILFDREGRPRIADLGLSCRIDDQSAMNERVGTSAYMPPGVFEHGFKDVRDDLYAYCLVVFEMFYGRKPFASAADRDLGRLVEVEREGGMPRALHEVLVRGLAPNRDDRWPDMTALLRQMERARRPKRWPWVAAVSVGLAASMAFGIVTARRAEADHCAGSNAELALIWNEHVRSELQGAFGTRLPGDNLDDWANRWLAVRARECEAAKQASKDVAVTPCSAKTLERFQSTVYAFRTPHLREGLDVVAIIADLPAPEHCTEHPLDADWGHGGLLELRDLEVQLDMLVQSNPVISRGLLVEYRERAVELKSEYGVARAIYFRGEIRRVEGALREAAADFELARDRAWKLRAGELIGEAQMKLAAVASMRGDVEVVDAHAGAARGALEQFAPERVAELLQIHGLALVGGPAEGRERGVALLLQAVEVREAEVRELGRSPEDLSVAHESYARGLLAVGRASEAVEYLDRALKVHQARFGHGTGRTRGILKAKFSALVVLGRIEESVLLCQTVLAIHDDANTSPLYFEDALWFGDVYLRAGHRTLAARPLYAARARAAELGMIAEVQRFDLALDAVRRK
jgi:tetratricopeptide (TPR) repeat protein